MKIFFSAKLDKPFAQEALYILKRTGIEVMDHRMVGHKAVVNNDYTISYISPRVFTFTQLSMAQKAAINFHPGPPEYPGIGCTNFALYNGEKEFGITVHHMEPKVDSGKIIMVKRFPITKGETVWSLSQKCYAYIFTAFCEMVPLILRGWDFPRYKDEATEHWTRKPYTRKELNELCVITKDMDEEEITRRVRATTYPGMPGAYIKLGGHRFEI